MSGGERPRDGGPEPDGGNVRLALVTGPDADTMADLGRRLVEARLCACVNVVPSLTSIYRWEGAVEEDDEALAILKTTEGRLGSLEARVKEVHPYEEPEFLVFEVDAGASSYLGWVAESVADGRT